MEQSIVTITTDPILIVGGFASSPQLYIELRAHLAVASGRPVSIVPITTLDWMGVVASDSYGALLRILDRAVRSTLAGYRAQRLTVVAHSAGGILTRIYMGDKPYGPRRLVYHGHERINMLVTLGTPHTTTQRGRQGGINQIVYAQEAYPGAYWRTTRYISVIGRGICGIAGGHPIERGAFQSYSMLSGKGAQWGDGVVPLENGLLAGSRHVVLPGVRHDARDEMPWYGTSTAIVQSWWGEVEAMERNVTRDP